MRSLSEVLGIRTWAYLFGGATTQPRRIPCWEYPGSLPLLGKAKLLALAFKILFSLVPGPLSTIIDINLQNRDPMHVVSTVIIVFVVTIIKDLFQEVALSKKSPDLESQATPRVCTDSGLLDICSTVSGPQFPYVII